MIGRVQEQARTGWTVQQWMVIMMGLLALCTSTAAQAQSALAAVLTVRTAGVEIMRAETDRWLKVSQGSVMPIGSGDRIRTDAAGRASIVFEGGTALLLPQSELHLMTYEQTPQGGVRFVAAVNGIWVQRWDAAPASYTLTLEDGIYRITAPGTHSAVWALPDLTDAVAVAEGEAVIAAELEQQLAAGQMAWLSEPPQVAALEEPLNNARLEAHLFGCRGVVNTDTGQNLLVRRGMGTRYETLGYVPNREPVSAMAVNERQSWVRIQFRSHFGWVLRLALEMDCESLPRLPNNLPPERLYNVINAAADEVELLRPFYGDPPADPIFYTTR
jgi:hypothetical protein